MTNPTTSAQYSSGDTSADGTEPGMRIVELRPDRVPCDATVPSYCDDEVRHGCGHEATVEALWIDGQWHPRCNQHVEGYPTNRVRPLESPQAVTYQEAILDGADPTEGDHADG